MEVRYVFNQSNRVGVCGFTSHKRNDTDGRLRSRKGVKMSQETLSKKSFVVAGLRAIACGDATLSQVVASVLLLHEVVAISSVCSGYIVFYS